MIYFIVMAYPKTIYQGNLFVSYKEDHIEIKLYDKYWKYELLPKQICERCSNPLSEPDQILTGKCGFCSKTYGFDRAYAMGLYEAKGKNDIGSHILKLKEYGQKFFGKTLAFGLSLTIMHKYPELLNSDVMIPVPMNEEKLREKGFNHAEHITKIISEVITQVATPISIEKDLLRCNELFELRDKNAIERFEQVRGRYGINKEATYSRVLIIDDVLTTGATVSECAKVLKEAGVKEVNVLVAGRTKYEKL